MTMVNRASAWASKDFRALWRASALSVAGSEVGEIALPVLALLVLDASATELSWVRMALFAPFLLLTLPLGVLVDRHPGLRLMILADAARGLLLLTVAGLALTGGLGVPILVALVAVLGACTVLHGLADFSLLPQLLTPGQLPDGNARLTATHSSLGVAGQGVGGALVQVVTAPWAVVVNGATYLGSALLLRRVSTVTDRPPRTEGSGLQVAWSGLQALRRHRAVRALAVEATIWNLGNEVLILSITILVLRTYDLGPLALGLVLMAGGVGAATGSAMSARLTRAVGYGPGLITALAVGNTAPLAVRAFTAGTPGRVVVLALTFLVSGLGIGVANSQAVTVRQLAVPEGLRGRVNAAYRFLSWGALAVGALTAGQLVAALGTHRAAVIGAAVMACATIPVVLSPVRRMRSTLDEYQAHTRR